jgi:tripartite-type tricarboxylate transporter receptor subunit TctC
MHQERRRLGAARLKTMTRALVAAALLAASNLAAAQSWPSKQVTWIIPFAPGGNFDLLTRGFGPPLSAALGVSVVPENRPANNGNAANEYVAKATPDGHTILTAGAASMYYAKLIYSGLQYDPERDFTRISGLARSPIALFVASSVPAASLQELLAYLKANPGKLNYGAAGHGHPFHLSMEMLLSRTGTQMVFVPYKGMAPVIQETVAGRLHALFFPPSQQMAGLVKAGKLRGIATATEKRLSNMPDMPTFDEAGLKDFYVSGTIGLFAPGGTPREVVTRLSREVARIAATPELQKLYDAQSVIPYIVPGEELTAQARRENAAWEPLIKALKIKAE